MNLSISKRLIFFSEVKQSFFLALPLIFANLVQAASGFIGTLMIAHLGKDELAASALVYSIYLTLIVFCFGVLNAISIFIAQNHGSKNYRGISLAASQGLLLSVVISIPMIVILLLSPYALFLSHQNPHVIRLSTQYLYSLSLCILPLGLLISMEQFLIGLSKTKLVLLISVFQVPFEILVNYIYVFGKFGFPKLGIAGLGYGYATVFSVAAIMIALVLSKSELSKKYRPFAHLLQFNKEYFIDMLRVGFPIGFMYVVEVAFFLVVAFFMGRLSRDALAAHQIAIQYIELTMMIVYGLSMSTSVRVGHAVGQGNKEKIKLAVYANMFIGYCATTLAVVYYILWPKSLIALDLNIHNPQYIKMVHYSVVFLAIGGIGILIDNFRFVILGALRGLKDARIPMVITAAAFWLFGLPVAYLLAFILKLEGAGLWYGIIAGMIAASLFLYLRLNRFLKKADLHDVLS